jgi:hypothetical protein
MVTSHKIGALRTSECARYVKARDEEAELDEVLEGDGAAISGGDPDTGRLCVMSISTA